MPKQSEKRGAGMGAKDGTGSKRGEARRGGGERKAKGSAGGPSEKESRRHHSDGPEGRRGSRNGGAGTKWRFSPADLATCANMGVGALAIIFALAPDPVIPGGWPDGVTLASSLIILALVLDGLDGALARLWGGSPLGIRLDSAADFVSFCLAPGALAAAAYWDHSSGIADGSNALCAAVALAFALAGGKRLLDFTREGHKRRGFTGLATPAAAFCAVVVVHVWPAGSDMLPGGVSPQVQLLLVGLTTVLMVAPLKYPKIRGAAGAALAVALCLALLYLSLRKSLLPIGEDELFAQYDALRLMALALILAYVFGGAVYSALRSERDH